MCDILKVLRYLPETITTFIICWFSRLKLAFFQTPNAHLLLYVLSGASRLQRRMS